MTIHFSVTPQPEPIKPHGRLWRILDALRDGPQPTPAVYLAARKRRTGPPARENVATRQCLAVLVERGLIRRELDMVEATDAGRRALAEADGAVTGRRAA